MRIPDNLKNTVCFLAVKLEEAGTEKPQYGGTGFFVSVPGELDSRLSHTYLVTAKHCIERAKTYGNLHLRLNFIPEKTDFVDEGEAELVPMSLYDWIYPDDDAIDIAVSPFNLLTHEAVNQVSLPIDALATDEKINTANIGAGDEVFALGLFTFRYGRYKNLPIVRSGTIASMPDEPLQDESSGLDYNAYLIEARSMGGLSGSPVFATFGLGLFNATATAGVVPSPLLLGLIRGHWDLRERETIVNYSVDELLTVNTGIAIVTPIQEVMKLLVGEELKKERRRQEKEVIEQNPHLFT